MAFRRKKSTARKTLEGGAGVAAGYAGDLGHKIVDNAPVVRDQVTATLGAAAGEIARRVPDLVDRLPDQVSDKLPESVQPKPKKRRLRKILVIGTIATAGGVVFSKVRGAQQKPAQQPTWTPPSTDNTGTTPPPVSTKVEKLVDGAAPDAVK